MMTKVLSLLGGSLLSVGTFLGLLKGGVLLPAPVTPSEAVLEEPSPQPVQADASGPAPRATPPWPSPAEATDDARVRRLELERTREKIAELELELARQKTQRSLEAFEQQRVVNVARGRMPSVDVDDDERPRPAPSPKAEQADLPWVCRGVGKENCRQEGVQATGGSTVPGVSPGTSDKFERRP